MTNESNCNGMHFKGDGSYWLYDARGIALARVCEGCRTAKVVKFRPEVLSDSNYEADEAIYPDGE